MGRAMLVRAVIPLALSCALLFFGPTAHGDLELDDVPAVETTELEPVVAAAGAVEPLDPLTEALLVSRLATLDREIPGLSHH